LLGGGTGDYEDILLDSGEASPQIVSALLSRVLRHAGWDVLQSKRLREDAALLQHGLPLLGADPRLRVEVRQFSVAPFLSVNGDWTAYWETRRKSMRKDTERQERRLAREIGEIECRRPSSREDVLPMMDVLERLHRARWSEEKGDGSFFENPRLRGFYRDVAAALYDAGRLDLEMMLAGEHVVSAHLGVRAGAWYGYLVPALDPALGRYSPGRLHLIRLLHRCFDSRLTEFDMLIGDEPYKNEFASGYRTIKSLRVAPTTLRGRLAFWWFGAARDRLRASRVRRALTAMLRRGILRKPS
jgi:CelD/BcsL family acetyltransferase involved in cellulose biosynthesis